MLVLIMVLESLFCSTALHLDSALMPSMVAEVHMG